MDLLLGPAAEPECSSADDSEASREDSARGVSAKKSSSGEYLESLSRSMLDVCLNLKDPDHPLIHQHQSPNFRSKHDTLDQTSSLDSHHANLAKHMAEQVDVHIEVLNTSSEIDDSRGRASVYVWYVVNGLAHGLGREAVALLKWERKQGTWVLIKHIGMRGPAGFWSV